MKITFLMDNNPHPEQNLFTEHGLCICIEANGLKWLLDLGASGKFHENAKKLGIATEAIDHVLLSHGHADHTGGLEQFLSVNKKAKIFLAANIEGKRFISTRRASKRDITINHALVAQNPERFIPVKENFRFSEQTGIISKIPKIHSLPKGNRKLFMIESGIEKPDNFQHELVLAVNSPKGMVVFSGCSHNGILNILDACSAYFGNSKIIACIGGTHLIDSDPENIYESDSEIAGIGETILRLYPDMQLITGHCTGGNASKILSEVMGKNFKTFHSGAVFEF